MGKQIAVLMCAVNLDNQRKLLEGMIDAARETDSNLFVFASYISYKEKEENLQGAYQIMRLPDFRQFDGAIIAKNSIQYRPAAEYAEKALRESGIPAVSIDLELPGMSSVGISSYESEFELIEHFITEHGCREIYYVSGPLNHPEGKKRYQAYCDALEKYGIEYNEDRVYYGFFNTDSGMVAAEIFLRDGNCPEVIVCANDAMAVGAIQVVKNHGYQIPQDVKIAGFDNAELSALHNPSLTTVNKNQHEVGYQAVKELFHLAEGAKPARYDVPCHLEIRSSCGCMKDEISDIGWLKNRYVYHHVLTQSVADIMRNMIADFSGMENPGELIEALKKYVLQTNMESFYLCLCDKERLFMPQENNLTGTLDVMDINTDYTPQITVPLAYEDGEFKSYGEFPKGQVLPDVCRKRSGGNYYVVVPIYYQRCCYGYCISGNSRFPLEHSLYYSWIMNIGIGLENIRKWMMLKDTVVKLNNIWVYDMLTHMYNRAGFYHYAAPALEKMREEEKDVFLMFMDIDGLKIVNDTMGHECGDRLICGVAEVVMQCVSGDHLTMRYGGDEFVVFGSCEGKEEAEQLMNKIKDTMKERNQQKKEPFELRASIGVSIYRAKDIDDLNQLIEQADKKMYEEKKKKRNSRKNNINHK